MRRLAPDEAALWAKVIATVRPLHGQPQQIVAESDAEQAAAAPPKPLRRQPPPKAQPQPTRISPGETLDGSWDRRLSRGLVQPDFSVDLHGHNLANAYSVLDDRLEQAIAAGARVLLLITGKPPISREPPIARGAIRAAVGDWLAASRHAGAIAAVRNAHPRHGGAGALYIILRKRRG